MFSLRGNLKWPFLLAIKLSKSWKRKQEGTIQIWHLNILATIYQEQGRFEESVRIFQETLEIRETVLGLKLPVVASTLNNLSVLHGKCGNFKTAEPLCQRALEIRKEVS